MTRENQMYCVDFETTRDERNQLHIIEIGAIQLDERLKPLREFSSLVQPPCRLNPIDARVTGLSESDLRDQESCSHVFPRFLSFIGDAIILAHNANFEKKIVATTCERLGITSPKLVFVDTLRLAKKFIKADSYSLSNLANTIGLSYSAHRSLSDCHAAARLFSHIIENMRYDDRETAVREAIQLGKLETVVQESLF